MPFVNYNWEIKNKETSAGLTRLIWWMHQWRLPLLFFISGVGIHFSFKKEIGDQIYRGKVCKIIYTTAFRYVLYNSTAGIF